MENSESKVTIMVVNTNRDSAYSKCDELSRDQLELCPTRAWWRSTENIATMSFVCVEP